MNSIVTHIHAVSALIVRRSFICEFQQKINKMTRKIGNFVGMKQMVMVTSRIVQSNFLQMTSNISEICMTDMQPYISNL